MLDVMTRIYQAGVVPVVVLDDVKDAAATAKALLDGGIDVMEITFRTAVAADAIRTVRQTYPQICVGAGSISSLEQCKLALESGATYIVSPGLNEETVQYCIQHGIPVLPGCVTPTEIMVSMRYGLKIVKFFPANIYGGLSAMKALNAPFPELLFIPTGGVNAGNLEEYLSASYVYAVGGSWLCCRGDIVAGRFEKITELCAQAHQIVQKARKMV